MIAQDIEKILLSEEEIENRCVELAHQIEEDYKESGETPIVRWNRIYWRCSYFKGYGSIL